MFQKNSKVEDGRVRAHETAEAASLKVHEIIDKVAEHSEQGAERDPQEWVTGDEPMTGPQRSYLDTLAREAGEQLSPDLTKAEASEHIDRLQGSSDRVPEQE